MPTIKSDAEIAQTYASQLSSASQSLRNIDVASKDTLTELGGNERNHAAIDESKALINQVASVLETASSNLQTLASQFDAADQANAERFKGE